MSLIESVQKTLKSYPDPETGKPIEDAGRVMALREEAGVIKFILDFPNAKDAEDFEPLRIQLIEAIRALNGVQDVQIAVSAPAAPKTATPKGAPPNLGNKPSPAPAKPSGIKHIYAIASGKGGVGKSTITSNLAVALALEGKKIGILDADIYGPSQVMMMGTKTKPTSSDGKIEPTMSHQVKMISIGQMIPDGEAIIWRGPMLMKALDQLLNDVSWGSLDALLIDLPPGTGDVQLSLSQKAQLSGAIIVTTPQDIAMIDARRAISMFDKLSTPIIGMIENMATHICTNCGHEDHIFGEGGAKAEAEKRNIPYLGALPLTRATREAGDQGKPIALGGQTLFNEIAARMVAGKMV